MYNDHARDVMDDRRKTSQTGGSKPTPVPGISPTEAAQLRSRVDRLEKMVQEHFAEKNQWNSLVREWVGSQVRIELMTGHALYGTLLWVDRYTMCLKDIEEPSDPYTAGQVVNEGPLVIHKGAVATIGKVVKHVQDGQVEP